MTLDTTNARFRAGHRAGRRFAHAAAYGFSMVELMVALTIGTVILIGITTLFANSGSSREEMERSGQLIENGRFAIELLFEDLRHAGFYGHYSSLTTFPAALPDPCDLDAADLLSAMPLAIQGYAAANLTTRPNLSATSCDNTNSTAGDTALSLLVDNNLQPGSDVLVVRRAETTLFTGTPTIGDAYLQASNQTALIQFGAAGASVPTTTANGGANTLTLFGGVASPTRKYHVHIYFVAPCAIGSGTNGVCSSGDDDIPTLKRLELTASGGATRFEIHPLVEGVEYFKLEYGVDNTPGTASLFTGFIGDGIPDSYTAAPAGTAAWGSVVAVRSYLLIRNLESTRGHNDDKSYTLGATAVAAANDEFKRHVFSNETRLTNVAGRRENST